MEKFNDSNIREVQFCALDIMTNFANFCNTHNLRYFLDYGTLLGAVRHKGFIPWDDDIDISMPRKDYQRLIELKDQLPFPYQLRSWRTDDSVNFLFLKVENINTTKIESDNDSKYIGGISIDIFPKDGLPSDAKVQDKHIRKFYFYKTLRDYEKISSIHTLKQGAYKLLSFFIKKLQGIESYEVKLENLCNEYDYDSCDTSRNFYGTYGKRETYKKTCFGEGCALIFEGKEFIAPCCWDNYLNQIYGDYMKLPPEEKRCTTHNISSFSLTDSYIK
ncbi:MAG: LicD family protein [Eubacterium sp.]|nr:LicD family protein [Eubacterium sp.]